ncbi:MAG: D-glycero-beta-D-manno-heptose-7-phosphate kinase [Cyclobacteriaceae bacterium]|nr:D-glycero-beta-D-manno-heptose-7-phosphate kinase [Cyclobacteriaceae bacterium]
MQSWPDVFAGFSKLKVLIIGDVMVDAYIWGVVERISPEAPVPIIQVTNRDNRLGGAANVALNVLSLGATPILCAISGEDDNGKLLDKLLADKKLSREGIVRSTTRPTTVKARVIASHQHVVRIDQESDQVATAGEEKELLSRIEKLLPGCDVVVFEDYDKGVITPSLIAKTVQWAKEKDIPTVVDPKKRNFLHYKDVTLFKPNLKELREGLKIEVDPREMTSVKEAVRLLKDRLAVEGVMLTMSEHGVFIDHRAAQKLIPAHKREIADVSGAGDTVVSIAALCVALGLTAEEIAFLSNLGGGLVCQHVGVVPIDRNELLEEANRESAG